MGNIIAELSDLYKSTTNAGHYASQYWADIAVNSNHSLAPLAHIPGVFAALWTPTTAPKTALTLGTAGYGFVGLPKTLVHFTTTKGVTGIIQSQSIKATTVGLFGPAVYLTRVGRPLNLFVRAKARTPIPVATPNGTARIIPYLVYARWGLAPLVLD